MKISYIKYIIKYINGFKNKKIRDFVIGRGSLEYVKIVSNGDKNRGKAYYDLHIGQANTGFFAIFRDLLNALAFADHYGLFPIVTYDRSIEYAEQDHFMNTNNPYEYYFEQPIGIPSGQSEAVILDCKTIIKHSPIQHERALELFGFSVDGYGVLSEDVYDLYSYIIKKYIKIKDDIIEKIQDEKKQLLAGIDHYMGVHVRGTDFFDNRKGHPRPPEVKRYFEEIDRCNKKLKIFLATDDKEILESFLKRYGDRVCCFNDVKRGSKHVPAHYGDKKRIRARGAAYRMGYEVLRDVIILADANIFVSGFSQVSIAAECFNRCLEQHFEEHIYIKTKIN